MSARRVGRGFATLRTSASLPRGVQRQNSHGGGKDFFVACGRMNSVVADPVHASLAAQIEEIVARTPITDIHTHLYDPAFGELLQWGIDDLLVYHYLVAEV